MSGVDIEFSVEDEESNTQDNGDNENEGGDSRTQATTATGGPSRIQGQWHFQSSKQSTNPHW